MPEWWDSVEGHAGKPLSSIFAMGFGVGVGLLWRMAKQRKLAHFCMPVMIVDFLSGKFSLPRCLASSLAVQASLHKPAEFLDILEVPRGAGRSKKGKNSREKTSWLPRCTATVVSSRRKLSLAIFTWEPAFARA